MGASEGAIRPLTLTLPSSHELRPTVLKRHGTASVVLDFPSSHLVVCSLASSVFLLSSLLLPGDYTWAIYSIL